MFAFLSSWSIIGVSFSCQHPFIFDVLPTKDHHNLLQRPNVQASINSLRVLGGPKTCGCCGKMFATIQAIISHKKVCSIGNPKARQILSSTTITDSSPLNALYSPVVQLKRLPTSDLRKVLADSPTSIQEKFQKSGLLGSKTSRDIPSLPPSDPPSVIKHSRKPKIGPRRANLPVTVHQDIEEDLKHQFEKDNEDMDSGISNENLTDESNDDSEVETLPNKILQSSQVDHQTMPIVKLTRIEKDISNPFRRDGKLAAPPISRTSSRCSTPAKDDSSRSSSRTREISPKSRKKL